MKRVLLISLSLVLALVSWSAVCADDGFYVIGGGGSASVPKTGQTTSYATRDDGALKKGVAWPSPRFTDNGDNTVTDSLTKLVWTKNANYWGTKTWMEALGYANSLHDEYPVMIKTGVHDGSKAGDWRLPNIRELQSLVDYGRVAPPLPSDAPFTNVLSGGHWSSSTVEAGTTSAWCVNFGVGNVFGDGKLNGRWVWCVRGGP
jgi:hypothetical protein